MSVLHGLSFRRCDAEQIFSGIGERKLVLALLAGIAPRLEWNGTEVLLASGGPEPGALVCVGARGPAAKQFMDALAQALGRLGISLFGPCPRNNGQWPVLAHASSGRWEALPISESRK